MWGDGIAPTTSATHTLTVGHVTSELAVAELTVTLHGYTDDLATSPDHHVRLRWNGVAVEDAWWDGRQRVRCRA